MDDFKKLKREVDNDPENKAVAFWFGFIIGEVWTGVVVLFCMQCCR